MSACVITDQYKIPAKIRSFFLYMVTSQRLLFISGSIIACDKVLQLSYGLSTTLTCCKTYFFRHVSIAQLVQLNKLQKLVHLIFQP